MSHLLDIFHFRPLAFWDLSPTQLQNWLTRSCQSQDAVEQSRRVQLLQVKELPERKWTMISQGVIPAMSLQCQLLTAKRFQWKTLEYPWKCLSLIKMMSVLAMFLVSCTWKPHSGRTQSLKQTTMMARPFCAFDLFCPPWPLQEYQM